MRKSLRIAPFRAGRFDNNTFAAKQPPHSPIGLFCKLPVVGAVPAYLLSVRFRSDHFLLMPYMMLLAFPTIVFGFLAPEVIVTNRAGFFAAYIVNYVVVSYMIGELAGRVYCRKRASQSNSAQ